MELNSPLTVRSSKFIVLQTLQTVAQEGKSLTGYFIFFFSLKKKKIPLLSSRKVKEVLIITLSSTEEECPLSQFMNLIFFRIF